MSLVSGLVTTDSYDLPTPPVVATYDMRKQANTYGLPPASLNIVDLLRAQLEAKRHDRREHSDSDCQDALARARGR